MMVTCLRTGCMLPVGAQRCLNYVTIKAMERKWLVLGVVVWHVYIAWSLVTEYWNHGLHFKEYAYIALMPLYVILVIIGIYSRTKVWIYVGLLLSLAMATAVMAVASSEPGSQIWMFPLPVWKYPIMAGEILSAVWLIFFLGRAAISKTRASHGASGESKIRLKHQPATWWLLGCGFAALLIYAITLNLVSPDQPSASDLFGFAVTIAILYIISLHTQRPWFNLVSIIFGILAITLSIYWLVFPPSRTPLSPWSFLFIILNAIYISCYVNMLSYDLELLEEASSSSVKDQPSADQPATQP